MTEDEARKLLESHGFTIANTSYRTSNARSSFKYRMVIRVTISSRTSRLAASLRALEQVREFRSLPTGD
jgi:putative Mg2+ transporter-C (MgtC) family protein